MPRTPLALSALIGAAAALTTLASAPAEAAAPRVSCGSANYGPAACAIPGGYRDARLVKRTSKAACARGRTWGVDRGEIWVTDGCSGVFEAAGSRGALYSDDKPLGRVLNALRASRNGWTLECGSRKHRRNACDLPRGHGRVTIARQMSKAACVRGSTWAVRGGQVIVDRGCAAVFNVARATAVRDRDYDAPGGGDHRAGTGQRIACGSVGHRPAACALPPGVRDVRLVNRKSKASCVRGRSWGVSGRELWVDQGCAGIFEATARRGDAGRGDYDRADRSARLDDRRSDRDARAIRLCQEFGERNPSLLGARTARATGEGRVLDAEGRTRRVRAVFEAGRTQNLRRVTATCRVERGLVTVFRMRDRDRSWD